MMRRLMSAAAAACLCASPAHALVEWTVASGGNGHFYDYYSGPAITFEEALAHAAAATPIAGYTAHMATVTSAAESQFIYNSFNGPNWGAQGFLAGSDADVEGEWRWMAGPEEGLLFWTGGEGGSSPNYANWQPGLPFNREDLDVIYAYERGATGWSNRNGAEGASNYVLEYSPNSEFAVGVPEPTAWATMLVGFFGLGAMFRRRRAPALA